MKVCLVSELFHPVYAGPAVRFRRYLPHFRRMGVEVSVFSGTASDLKHRMSGLTPETSAADRQAGVTTEVVDGHDVHRVNLPEDSGSKRARHFAEALRAHCENSRIDVLQLLWVPRSRPRLLDGLRATGIPLVYTMTMVQPLSRSWSRAWIQRRRRRAWLDRLDEVVVSSASMRDELERIGTSAAVEVIPNGVDTLRFRPPGDDEERMSTRRELQIPADAPVVLFVGPISPRKGVDLLLDAWTSIARRCPEAHLLLVGPRRDLEDDGLSAFAAGLRELEAVSGAGSRIHYAGMVSAVEEFMRASDVFVFPSRREGMPNVVPEAMATGLPVVCARFDGYPDEFGRDGEHLLVVPHDSARIADATSYLLSDRDAATALGGAGRRWILKTMPIEDSVAAYVRRYEALSLASPLNPDYGPQT